MKLLLTLTVKDFFEIWSAFGKVSGQSIATVCD